MKYKNFLPTRTPIVVEDHTQVVKEQDLRHTMKSVAATTEKVEEHKERYRRDIESGTESKKFGKKKKREE